MLVFLVLMNVDDFVQIIKVSEHSLEKCMYAF